MRTIVFIALCFLFGVLFAVLSRILDIDMTSTQMFILTAFMFIGVSVVHGVDLKLKSREEAKKK